MTDRTGSASSTGAQFGEKVRGVFQTVHGVGESIRGGTMDFLDSATGTGGGHPATTRGAREVEQGNARMDHGTAANTGIGTTNPTTSSNSVPEQDPSIAAIGTGGGQPTTARGASEIEQGNARMDHGTAANAGTGTTNTTTNSTSVPEQDSSVAV